MIVRQKSIAEPDLLAEVSSTLSAFHPHIVFAFGHPRFFSSLPLSTLKERFFPGTHLLGCSTAGEIFHAGVTTDSMVLTALRFDQSVDARMSWTEMSNAQDSEAAGWRLGKGLNGPGLRNVLVFAPGVEVDGTALIRGMKATVGEDVGISGGLAGDADAFHRTFTLCDDKISDRGLVALGFYGDRIAFRHGCYGGWRPFGPVRQVTRQDGNILLELDGKPALDVYKHYLGAHANGLPATGLLFPFAIIGDETRETGLIRSIIGIDEQRGGLIFAGDIPAGCMLRLMQANTDTLVDGAQAAADAVAQPDGQPSLALLVSCVGRRLVMAGRVDEEVEAVADVFGTSTTVAGYYSYGEISPVLEAADCCLHNQTMTITYMVEK